MSGICELLKVGDETEADVFEAAMVGAVETDTCVLLVDGGDVEFETFKDPMTDGGVDADGGCVSSICEILRGSGEL